MKQIKQLVWILIAIFIIAGLMLTACSSKSDKDKTIGIINLSPALEPSIVGFKAGLAELEYTEGENLTYIYAGPVGSPDKVGAATQALLDAKVDMIFAVSDPAVAATKPLIAGTDIPVIFSVVSDPEGLGLVESMQNPGGNYTGVALRTNEARRVELLTEINPHVKKIFVPYDAGSQTSIITLETVKDAASKLGLELALYEINSNPDEVTAAIENVPEDADVIFVLRDPIVAARLPDWSAKAVELGVILSAPSSEHLARGAMYAYGPSQVAAGKQAARIADQVFGGTKTGDMPVEIAELYFSINLPLFEAIGLDLSDETLRKADEVVR